MTIEEAIAHEREKAKEQKSKYDKCTSRMIFNCEMCFHKPKCNEVEEQHEQIAELLEELKLLKEEKFKFQIIARDIYEKGYNKAIDDFAEKFIYKAVCEGCSGCCNCYEESRQNECEDYKSYMEIAEQLREGEWNE